MPTATIAPPPPAPTHPLMNDPRYGAPITIPALACCGELPGECTCPTMTSWATAPTITIGAGR